MKLPFYDASKVAPITVTASRLMKPTLTDKLRRNLAYGSLTAPARRTLRERITSAWLAVRMRLAPCPVCDGHGVERADAISPTGLRVKVERRCGMCDGRGTWAAYRRRRDADVAWLNRPASCGCPECSGEWDR
jgi:hypothetical protein